MLEYGDTPAFDWTLEAFACCYGSCVGVLSFFEDFFGGHWLSQKRFCVFKLLWDGCAADFDFGYVRFLFSHAGLFRLCCCDNAYVGYFINVVLKLLKHAICIKVFWQNKSAVKVCWRFFHPSFG